MKRLFLLLALTLLGCPDDPVDETATRLRLVRRPAGRVAIEIAGAPSSPRALQLELKIDGAGTVEEPMPPSGAALDTVRLRMAGASSARLFAADARGIRLAQDGEAMTFAVRAEGEVTLSINSALLVDDAGRTMPVEHAGTLVIR